MVCLSATTSLLIKAIIIVESSNNPLAVSPRNARGCMQLTDIGVQEVRNQYEDLRFIPLDPFNPVQNVLFGSRLLQFYIREANMNIKHGLVLYNGGYGALKQWQKNRPYPESVNYVNKVCKLYPKCNTLVGPRQVPLSIFDTKVDFGRQLTNKITE